MLRDNSTNTNDTAIYNDRHAFLYYPYVAFTVDANGDTKQADTTTQSICSL